ncbi:AI-2E family transporter [Sulfuritalea hydrogenivorans]|uniref:Putative permease n=1 Tax=Sulfuritalea hydrogenivorans sk43H TaxID=1223802 RepID=W0S9N1_9PROT|nr:AI-2E family transporter [Sulfuritalea hydrogenivorans]MDK9713786.1 AI-2E family transporter [Sulfuritalea sp.]BAO27889.1 putative permease [Sulfuritalea hydrogenivorans sk43H]
MLSPRSDRFLAILALTLLGAGCVLVLWPFLTALIWAAILVSTSWPAFRRLDQLLGERRTLAATLMTLLVTVVLLGPIAAVALALADNVAELGRAATALAQDGLPDAPDWLASLPLLGQTLHDYWQQFVHDGHRLKAELEKLAKPAQVAAIAGGRMVGRGVLDMGLSVFLAFFFFLHGEALARRLRIALERLTGVRATHLLGIMHDTVSGVIYGILGTGLAQGVLAAIGFVIAGVPGAVLLGGATFFLSVVPVGPPLVWGGAAIWLFQQGQPGWAVFVAIWGFFVVSTVDNVIKPFIISRGANLPFAIVFLGVLGGVLAFGVIGAFLGPTLLAVGYRLSTEWTTEAAAPPAEG